MFVLIKNNRFGKETILHARNARFEEGTDVGVVCPATRTPGGSNGREPHIPGVVRGNPDPAVRVTTGSGQKHRSPDAEQIGRAGFQRAGIEPMHCAMLFILGITFHN